MYLLLEIKNVCQDSTEEISAPKGTATYIRIIYSVPEGTNKTSGECSLC